MLIGRIKSYTMYLVNTIEDNIRLMEEIMKRKIVLASHGELSEGIAKSAKMIVEEFDCEVVTYSLQVGHHPDEFKNELEKEIKTNTDVEYVIMTDLFGASVTNSLFTLTSYENVKVFTGMNLNMLLSVLVEYKNELSEADVENIVNDSRLGVRSLKNDILTDNEDF